MNKGHHCTIHLNDRQSGNWFFTKPIGCAVLFRAICTLFFLLSLYVFLLR